MKKNYPLLVVSIVLMAVIAVSLVNASSLKLLCLDKGETIKFSKCSSDISDRTCTNNAGCQFCVDETSNGIYCPKNINDCNNAGLECSSMSVIPNTILGTSIGTSISIDNTPGSNTNTSTNTNTGNNTNINTNIDDGTIHLGGNTNTNTTNPQAGTTSSATSGSGNSGALGVGLGIRITVGENSNNSNTNLNPDGNSASEETGFFEKAKNFLTGKSAGIADEENSASEDGINLEEKNGIGFALGVLFLFNIIIFVFLLNYNKKMDKSLDNTIEDN